MILCFSQPRSARWLLGLGLLLNVAIVALAVSLIGSPAGSSMTSPRQIAIPLEDAVSVWDQFRRWVVQEDGRNKPFDTFCRESVRAITGRERFEQVRSMTTGHLVSPGHDPVAVVASWLLLGVADGKRAAPPSTGCDWEHYPFLWCRNSELRSLIYGEQRNGAALTDEERFGHHIEPAIVRGSPALLSVLRQAFEKRERNSRAPLLPVEREALDLQGRLELYDRICRGGAIENGHGHSRRPGEFQVVALDRDSPTWFSLATVNALTGTDGRDRWRQIMHSRRLEEGDSSAETSLAALPAEQIKRILAAFTALQIAYRSDEPQEFAKAADNFFVVLQQVHNQFHAAGGTDTTERELWYNRVNPFRKAWLFDAAATLLFTIGLILGARWRWAGRLYYVAGLAAAALCVGWAVTGFIFRVSIAGRPPVSNMYESLIWVAFMALVFGLVLESIFRRGIIILAAALVSTLGFVLADQLPLTFSPALQPLQAVLRSNYWLVVHVLTIVSSYAPFALAWGLGNLNLGLILFAPGERALIRTMTQFCYRAIQIGVLLLFLGTMLGGFWAAESWGRFWGWDPKEVWALIALLCYLIPLHARYVGWVGDFGLSVAAAVCFASVVMAWYGVNFVLGAGLHSYGFGSGDDRWIYLTGLANISLVVHAAWRLLGSERHATCACAVVSNA